jgi:hypothetical protein
VPPQSTVTPEDRGNRRGRLSQARIGVRSGPTNLIEWLTSTVPGRLAVIAIVPLIGTPRCTSAWVFAVWC